jgi:hypothetical protein
MKENQKTTVKEIVLVKYAYSHSFGKWEVFIKSNSFLYWNKDTSKIDRIATYVNGKCVL